MPFRVVLVLGLIALFFAALVGVMVWAMWVQIRSREGLRFPETTDPSPKPPNWLWKGLIVVATWSLAISASGEMMRLVRTGVLVNDHGFVTLAEDRSEFQFYLVFYGLGTVVLVVLAIGALALIPPIRRAMQPACACRESGPPLSLREACARRRRSASSARADRRPARRANGSESPN